jgi:ABC-type lipoprotein release transport system permease subunit
LATRYRNQQLKVKAVRRRAVAALASSIPAWRAAKVDPLQALRHD